MLRVLRHHLVERAVVGPVLSPVLVRAGHAVRKAVEVRPLGAEQELGSGVDLAHATIGIQKQGTRLEKPILPIHHPPRETDPADGGRAVLQIVEELGKNANCRAAAAAAAGGGGGGGSGGSGGGGGGGGAMWCAPLSSRVMLQIKYLVCVHYGNPIRTSAIRVDTILRVAVFGRVGQMLPSAILLPGNERDSALGHKGCQHSSYVVVDAAFHLVIIVDDNMVETCQQVADNKFTQMHIIARDAANQRPKIFARC